MQKKSNAKKSEKVYTMPDCKLSDGVGQYVRKCKALGIPPSHAVRHYREIARKGKSAVVKLLASDTSVLTSFRLRDRKAGGKGFAAFGSV